MPRTVRSAHLENRTQRLKLPKEAYHWKAVTEGVALGYRRTKEGYGTWTVRVLADRAAGRYETKRIGRADDHESADGSEVFTYFQAADRARELVTEERHTASGKRSAPLTVQKAAEEYMEWFRAHRKSANATQSVINAHVLPRFGRTLVADLTTRDIQRWHEKLATTAKRARSGKDAKVPRLQDQDLGDPQVARRRKASANRILTVFRAILNHAWRQGHTPSDSAWRRVKPFHNAGEPLVRYLEPPQIRDFLAALPADFDRLARAALLTGCRYGELTELTVGDFRPEGRSVYIRDPKSGRSRHVPLNDEGYEFFRRVTAGRAAAETLLLRDGGRPWGVNHQVRPMQHGCEAAGIDPPVSFHVLRHTYGSSLVTHGVTLQVVGEVMGHADTRITQRHYGHLAPSYVAQIIRDNLPSLSGKPAATSAPATGKPARRPKPMPA